MKPEHKKWADHVIRGISPIEAYLLVYPTASRKTAMNRSSVFGKNEEVAGYIKGKGEKLDALVNDKLAEQELKKILSANEVHAMLYSIAMGELKSERVVVVNGEPKIIKVSPTHTERMKAAEIFNKMTGQNVLAKPAQVKAAEEVTKMIIMEDQTEAPLNPNGGDY
jgi:hypothetical protein